MHVNILIVYLTSRPSCKVPLNIHAMDETHTDPPPAGATSIPPAARCAANKHFIIPLNTRTVLLPDSSISLKQLAEFTLPTVKAVTSNQNRWDMIIERRRQLCLGVVLLSGSVTIEWNSLDIAEIREFSYFLAIFKCIWELVHRLKWHMATCKIVQFTGPHDIWLNDQSKSYSNRTFVKKFRQPNKYPQIIQRHGI